MFSGTLSGGEYAGAVTGRLAVFAAGTLAIPAALNELDHTQYCPPDLCGPMSATVITFLVMPLLYLGLAASLTGITVRRLRDIGLPVALGAIVPILMLGDLLAALTLDGFAFSSYRHAVHPVPGNIIMALACIGFLCLPRTRDRHDEDLATRWGFNGAVLLGVLTLAAVLALFKLMTEITMAASGIVSLGIVVYAITYAGAMIAAIPLVALLAIAAVRDLCRPA